MGVAGVPDSAGRRPGPSPAAAGGGGRRRQPVSVPQRRRTGVLAASAPAVRAAGRSGSGAGADVRRQPRHLGLSGQRQRHRPHGDHSPGAGGLRHHRGVAGSAHRSGDHAQPCAAGPAGGIVAGGERPGLRGPCAGGGAAPSTGGGRSERRHQHRGPEGGPYHQGGGAGGAGHGTAGGHRHGGATADLRSVRNRTYRRTVCPQHGGRVGQNVV